MTMQLGMTIDLDIVAGEGVDAGVQDIGSHHGTHLDWRAGFGSAQGSQQHLDPTFWRRRGGVCLQERVDAILDARIKI